MDSPPTYSEETRLGALREVLSGQENGSAELPSLKVDTSWVQQALQKAWDVIEPWIPEFSLGKDGFSFPVDPEGIWLTIKVLFLLTSAILLFKLFQYLLTRHGGAARGVTSSRPPSLGNLEALLERACTEGRWTEALRLRWALFLLRRNLTPSTTPQEFAHTGDTLSQLSDVLKGMFGPFGSAHERLFRDFDRDCEQAENSHAQRGAA